MEWFTADWHFFHKNIIKYAKRPFKDVSQMNRVIVKNIQDNVAPDDTLYVLGDVTLSGEDEANKLRRLMKNIPGRKILILGNHDRLKSFTYIDIGFESVHTSLDIGDFILVHDPAAAIIEPERQWLTAHVHQLYKRVANTLNVGIDVWDYKPVSKEQIIAYLQESKNVQND